MRTGWVAKGFDKRRGTALANGMSIAPLLFAALAGLAQAADDAGNRAETLTPVKAVAEGDPQPMLCNAAKDVCAIVRTNEEHGNRADLEIYDRPDGAAPIANLGLEGEIEPTRYRVWPGIVRLADGTLLVGAEENGFNGYSGGGGSATTLRLFRLDRRKADMPMPEIFTTVISAGISIRACFGERDMKDRRGACHDEYDFDAVLALDPVSTNGMPRLSKTTVATTYPGDVSRNEDSLAKGRLRKSDLVHKRREDCSYRRIFTFDPKSASYQPDSPEPDCSEFTVP